MAVGRLRRAPRVGRHGEACDRVRPAGVDTRRIIRNKPRDFQLVVADSLNDALGQLVAAGIVKVRAVLRLRGLGLHITSRTEW